MRTSILALWASVSIACGGEASSSGGTSASGAGGATSSSGSVASSGSGLGAGQCRSDDDCQLGFEFCHHQGEQIPFGGCGESCESSCTTDADCVAVDPNGICLESRKCCGTSTACTQGCGQDSDCGAAGVCSADHRCDPKPCAADPDCPAMFACLGASKTCALYQCVDASGCGEGESCASDHQCVGTPCSSDAGCVSNFRCGDSGICGRIACEDDSACEGFCVEGACYATPGDCEGVPS